tara:strand:+ start:212 stop:406 length:195 start_codon:yes stop_codon:yes gene_type:complete
LIRVGYETTDGSSVTHETVANAKLANESIALLAEEKASDASVNCFYLEIQITESVWDRYAFIDN